MYQNEVSVVIPSYNPDEKLESVVSGLSDAGFDDIIVIDDGSRQDCKKYFDALKAYPACTLLTHEVNRGKGAALKTAFAFFAKEREGRVGAVTADGDAQHAAEDICAVARALCETPDTFIIGARDFSLPQVPGRSRFGNNLTSFIFRTGVGMKISDTQSGLRGIPATAMEVMSGLKGDRYEYVTNALLALKKNRIPYREIPISTVYIDENATSHFRVIRDSVRIYANILKYAASSVVSFLIDYAVFNLLLLMIGESGDFAVAIRYIIARAVSSVFNYFINMKIVFKGANNRRTRIKYFSLVIVQGALGAGLTNLLAVTLGANAPVIQSLLKLAVDTTLFFGSYYIQKNWVFAEKDK